MATRSLTEFAHNTGEVVAVVYKHWDGNPDAMMPLFTRFFDRCAALSSPRFDDPFYLAAKWVVFLAEEDHAGRDDYTDDPLDFLGVGITAPGIEAYEDYVYTVTSQTEHHTFDVVRPVVTYREALWNGVPPYLPSV